MRRLSEWMMSCFFAPDEGAGGGSGAGAEDGNGGEGKGSGDDGKGGNGSGEEKFDATYVKQLRQEAAANRKKAAEAEAKLKAREDADLSETQKLQKQADEANKKAEEAEQRSRQRVARAEVLTEATKAKLVDPDAAYRLIRDDIEFGDDGEPKNVATLIKQLAKDRPYLITRSTGSADGGSGHDSRGAGGGMNENIRRAAGRA